MAITDTSLSQSTGEYSTSSNVTVAGIHQRVRDEISAAFQEKRAFPFYPRESILDAFRSGSAGEALVDELAALQKDIFANIAEGDATIERRFREDIELSSRITRGIEYIHRTIAESKLTTLASRRYVLIRERTGAPSIYYDKELVSVIHIGMGPDWVESPSIYCGLGLFDLLGDQLSLKENDGFRRFGELLTLEGAAIDAGISYSPELLHEKDTLTSYFINVLENKRAELLQIPTEPLLERFVPPFDERQKLRFYKLLDTRVETGSLNFDIDAVIKAENQLEKQARAYKRSHDRESLSAVVELLVAASGHDVHEVRNRANLCLERVFAPKEYDAPPAGVFANVRINTEHTFTFSLPKTNGSYMVRLYRLGDPKEWVLEHEIEYEELTLELNRDRGVYEASHVFHETGFFDFLVCRIVKRKATWLDLPGCSGRINVLPDVRGEIVLQIFTDIHGHTRAYWQKGDSHPGLVYNEHGEVIRIGRFSDVTAHLDDLQERFRISAIYLLGVFARGKNREDWAPLATSPSPFSPMSFDEFE